MTKELENSPKIGRPEGSLNKRNQEIYYLAEREGVDIALIKIRLAGLKLKELGYSKEMIESLTVKDLVEIQSKNANDLLPYFFGKRKPIDSQGDDSDSLLSVFLGQINDRE